jgi:hypothetical protein
VARQATAHRDKEERMSVLWIVIIVLAIVGVFALLRGRV